jgi:putative ABC transport system permease protein
MFDSDTWQEIIETVRANKLRTALTAFGVFWGILMLLLMLGSGNGLENGVTRNMSGFATNAVYVWGQRTTLPHEGLLPGRWVQYDNRDVQAIRQQIDGIEHMAPRNQLGGFRGSNTVSRGDQSSSFSVMGDYPQLRYVEPMQVVSGRFINELDIIDKRKVAIIGTRVQELLFAPGEDPIGDAIKINGVYFQVIGTFTTRQTGDRGERAAQTIYVPFTTFQQAFNYGDRVGWFAITAQPHMDVSKMEKDIRALLAARHKISPQDEQAIGSFNAKEEFGKVQTMFTGIRMFIWIVGAFTLLSGVIGVSNIMLISVKERTKEIGVRKALGATPSSIVSTVVQESVVLTSLSGYMGVVVGVAILEALNRLNIESDSFTNPHVNLSVALVATATLIVTGAIAGIIPAWHAASIKPVEALRAE